MRGCVELSSSDTRQAKPRLPCPPPAPPVAEFLLIPGTSSLAHLRENLAAAALDLPDGARDGVAASAGSPR